jgi:hypothetical protein
MHAKSLADGNPAYRSKLADILDDLGAKTRKARAALAEANKVNPSPASDGEKPG